MKTSMAVLLLMALAMPAAMGAEDIRWMEYDDEGELLVRACPLSTLTITSLPGGATFLADWAPYKGFVGYLEIRQRRILRVFRVQNGIPANVLLPPGGHKVRLRLSRLRDGFTCKSLWIKFTV